MVAHSVIAQVDCFGDFAGRGALVNQQGDFDFAPGQAFALELAEDFADDVRDARQLNEIGLMKVVGAAADARQFDFIQALAES